MFPTGARSIVLALALLRPLTARADEPDEPDEGTGFVQFKAGPGIRIEIEGHPTGVTSGKDGLIARGVKPGARRYSAHRDGFVSQFGVVMVEADAVSVRALDAWQPMIEVPVDKEKGFGSLIVETLPVDATILARRLGWKDKVTKGPDAFIAREIPAGRHKFTFCNEFKCIDYWVKIPNAGVQKLLIDFEPGHIFDVSKEFVADWKGAQARCEREREDDACKLACKADTSIHPEVPSSACNAINRRETTDLMLNHDDGMLNASAPVTREPSEDPGCDIATGSGFLSISSREPVEVLLGDGPIGWTPIVRQTVPSGCHQLVAITSDGQRHQVSIRVRPNEERRIKLTF